MINCYFEHTKKVAENIYKLSPLENEKKKSKDNLKEQDLI